MAKNDSNADLNADVEQALDRWVEWATSTLNLIPTEDEIERQREKIKRELAGEAGTEIEMATGRDARSWQDVEEIFQKEPDSVSILEDYQRVEKKHLEGVPFFINRWRFVEGEMGEFVVAYCITRDPVRTESGESNLVFFTDGSTGILRQLREITINQGKRERLAVRNGLNRSEYTADTDTGPKQAETFYLS
jgi:hypothetical protein